MIEKSNEDIRAERGHTRLIRKRWERGRFPQEKLISTFIHVMPVISFVSPLHIWRGRPLQDHLSPVENVSKSNRYEGCGYDNRQRYVLLFPETRWKRSIMDSSHVTHIQLWVIVQKHSFSRRWCVMWHKEKLINALSLWFFLIRISSAVPSCLFSHPSFGHHNTMMNLQPRSLPTKCNTLKLLQYLFLLVSQWGAAAQVLLNSHWDLTTHWLYASWI